MELRIKISPLMATEKSPLGSLEDRFLRVPKEIRDKHGLSIGEYLIFAGTKGEVNLQVARCYKEDTDADPESVYVTSDTHSRIAVKTMTSIRPAADILVGCDPEFFLVNHDNSRIISASTFFSHYGEIGSDCGLAELRPRPSMVSAEVTENIKGLLQKTYGYIRAREGKVLKNGHVDMLAKSYHDNKAAGFHIHFGLPAILLRDSVKTRITLALIVSVLDYYVGILSILPEGDEDRIRRSTMDTQYGKPGDHRFNVMTLEYRVPGGHLLRHPILTNGLMSMGLLVMKDFLSRMKASTEGFSRPFSISEYKDLRKLYPKLPDKEKVWGALTCANSKVPLGYTYDIFKDMEKMIGFDKYKSGIIPYFSYILKLMEKSEHYNEYIVPNWRLV